MELRDQFAMAAVQGLLASESENSEGGGLLYILNGEIDAERLARHAYQVADAMLVKKGKLRKKAIPATE